MPITLRNTKGSELTFAELDGNFTDLDGRVGVLEAAVDSDNQALSLNGADLTITGGNTINIASAFTTFGGSITASILPNADGDYNLGSPNFKFDTIHAETLRLGVGNFTYDNELGSAGEFTLSKPVNADVNLVNTLDVNDCRIENLAYAGDGYDNNTSETKGSIVFNASPVAGSAVVLSTINSNTVWEARLDGIVRIIEEGGYRTSRVTTSQLTGIATSANSDLADSTKVVGGASNTETDGANGLWVYDSTVNRNKFYINGEWKTMIPIEELQEVLPVVGTGAIVDDIINAINSL